jgi:hypothetical protein
LMIQFGHRQLQVLWDISWTVNDSVSDATHQ